MQKKHGPILERSFSWIRLHPDAMNLDVPEELASAWIFEDHDDEPRPAGYFLSVFSFGFLQQALLSSELPLSQPRSVASAELFENFGMWQLKLGLAEIHRRTNLKVHPLPLFRFPKGEEISYWLS